MTIVIEVKEEIETEIGAGRETVETNRVIVVDDNAHEVASLKSHTKEVRVGSRWKTGVNTTMGAKTVTKTSKLVPVKGTQ